MPVNFEVRRPPNRRAAKAEKDFPGTADCCPACKSPRVHIHGDHGVKFYGRQIAICTNCRTAWEPVDRALVWDPSDPFGSFNEPCDDCAFRPGSPEQADTATRGGECCASIAVRPVLADTRAGFNSARTSSNARRSTSLRSTT
jgi:hypothetical protein